jgi:hypothetical protein
MKTLNERYKYGLELFLLSVDEGITGYRDDSLEVGVPVPLSYLALYGAADSQAEPTTIQPPPEDLKLS